LRSKKLHYKYGTYFKLHTILYLNILKVLDVYNA